jgi:quercetin 2,3-dioxygenase
MTQTKQITRAHERGHNQLGWLNAWHSFSFGHHYDAERMGFGVLRVVNDDRIAPSGGFPSHRHKDMEIVTVVLEGRLEHKDSMGNGRVIEAGEIQYMSAGSGVVHSEFNPSSSEPVHLMQIWIEPREFGLEPRYADQGVVGTEKNDWSLVLSADGRDGSMAIRQDAELLTAALEPKQTISYTKLHKAHGLWLFVIEGEIQVVDETLGAGDSLALEDVDSLSLKSVGRTSAKVFMFDVSMR